MPSKNDILLKFAQDCASATPERRAELVAAAVARIAALEPAGRSLRCQVSAKGALSVYGINARFPVTLYSEQWERLLDFADVMRAFIVANKATRARKADKAAA